MPHMNLQFQSRAEVLSWSQRAQFEALPSLPAVHSGLRETLQPAVALFPLSGGACVVNHSVIQLVERSEGIQALGRISPRLSRRGKGEGDKYSGFQQGAGIRQGK